MPYAVCFVCMPRLRPADLQSALVSGHAAVCMNPHWRSMKADQSADLVEAAREVAPEHVAVLRIH